MQAYLWLNKSPLTRNYSICGLNHITAADYIGLFKEIILSSLNPEDTIIGCDGIVVEIDETKLIKNNINKEDGWMFGGVEKTQEKNIFLVKINDRKADTLIDEIKKHIKVGSVIHSDMWKGY